MAHVNHSDLHLGYATINTEVQYEIKETTHSDWNSQCWRDLDEDLFEKTLPSANDSPNRVKVMPFYIFWLRIINPNGIRSSWFCGSSIKNFVECKADQWGGWRKIVGEQFPSFYNSDWIWIRVSTCETGIQWTRSGSVQCGSPPVRFSFDFCQPISGPHQ